MTQKANFFKLGLFIIIAFTLFTAFLIAFGAGEFMHKELIVETCFNESVQGLDIGSKVKYKGVEIGSVKSITTPARVYNAASDYVLVTFALHEDCYLGQTGKDLTHRVRKAISKGLRTQLAFKGLTGAAYLETDYSPGLKKSLDISWKPRHIYIPSRKSSMKRLGDALSQILDSITRINIVGITNNLGEFVKTLNNKTKKLDMAKISFETEQLLAEVRKTNEKVSTILGSEKFKEMITDAQKSFSGLKNIVENSKEPINKALNDFQKTAGNAERLTTGLKTEFSPRLEHFSKNIDVMLKRLNKTSKILETMTWLNSDTINNTLDNFKTASENLKQFTMEIKHYPGRLLLEKPPGKYTLGIIKRKTE